MADITTISGLTKQYNPPNVPLAVNDIDLRIREAEIVSLLEPNTPDVLPHTLRITKELDVPVSSLTVQRPNLESVFLHLTGQRLTAEAE